MYKCDTCGKNSKAREGCNITPVEFRSKVYRVIEGFEVVEDHAPIGYEVVREEKKCSACFGRWIGGERPALPATKKMTKVMRNDEDRKGRSGDDDDSYGFKEDRHDKRRRPDKERF